MLKTLGKLGFAGMILFGGIKHGLAQDPKDKLPPHIQERIEQMRDRYGHQKVKVHGYIIGKDDLEDVKYIIGMASGTVKVTYFNAITIDGYTTMRLETEGKPHPKIVKETLEDMLVCLDLDKDKKVEKMEVFNAKKYFAEQAYQEYLQNK